MSELKLNMDERVPVKNLCDWDIYFSRIETIGTVKIPRKGIMRITRSEIQSQVYDRNPFFIGLDGKGSHAKVYIDDEDTRVLVGFEDEDSKTKQRILDTERIKKIIEYKTMATFKKRIEEEVKTHAEKAILVEETKKLGLNDHDKIKFIEEYTGFKFGD